MTQQEQQPIPFDNFISQLKTRIKVFNDQLPYTDDKELYKTIQEFNRQCNEVYKLYDPNTPSCQDIINSLEQTIANSINYAKQPASGFGSGEMLVYQYAGFNTPEDFCRARNAMYVFCLHLLGRA